MIPDTSRARRALPPLLVLVAATGCEAPPPTELVVSVSTVPVVGVPVETIEVEVRSEGGRSTYDRATFTVRAQGSDAGFSLPISFSVAPRGDAVSGRFRVVARGRWSDAAGAHTIEQRALTGFVEGQRLSLPMTLDVRCVDDDRCIDDFTCAPTGCAPARRDASSLRPINDGEGPPSDPCAARGDGCSELCRDSTRIATRRAYAAETGYVYRRPDGPLPPGARLEASVAFYVNTTARADLLPLHECRFAIGKLFLSLSPICDNVAQSNGVVGYVLPPTATGRCGAVPLYGAYHVEQGNAFFSTDASERDAALTRGYEDQGVVAYVWPDPS
ncbi:MAG: hypothetical protein R3A52_28715 [Polyangiales bacterium]